VCASRKRVVVFERFLGQALKGLLRLGEGGLPALIGRHFLKNGGGKLVLLPVGKARRNLERLLQLRHLDDLNPDELGLKLRFAVLEKHLCDFVKVLTQLVKGRPLTMGARPPRHVADVQPGVRIPFHDDIRRH
jgi:hypothetical protein